MTLYFAFRLIYHGILGRSVHTMTVSLPIVSVWTVSIAGKACSSSCKCQFALVSKFWKLTFGTTPTPSPINIGATVTTTVSTTGDPPERDGLRRNDDSTLEPPSIMTDFRPNPFNIDGNESGAIRPNPCQRLLFSSRSNLTR